MPLQSDSLALPVAPAAGTEDLAAPPAVNRPLSGAELAQVDQAVGTVNAILLRKNLEIAVEIHRYVLAEFFGGDFGAWQGMRPGAVPAYDAFIGHPGLRVGKEMLRQLVLVGEQARQLPGEVASELSVAQHRALLPLEDPAERAQLAERALAEKLTAQQLADVVRELHPPKPRAKGRPAQLRGFRRLGEVYKAGKGLDPQHLAAEVGRYTPHQREQVLARALAMKALAEGVLRALEGVG